jgi:protein-tyrosine phosphatase
MSVAAMRHWFLPDTFNIRDLGGYDRRSGSTTQWRRILRGEALHALSAKSVDELVDNGLALVVDLRGPHETGANAHPFRDHPGVRYTNIALYSALAPINLSVENFDMAQRYKDALDRCGSEIAAVFRAIISAPPGMVLCHCTAGKDRTGVISALILTLAGVSRADVAKDYALTASAEGLIDRLRARALRSGGEPANVERMLASDAQTMLAMLTHLDTAHGGIDAYCEKIGLAADEAQALVDRLCR